MNRIFIDLDGVIVDFESYRNRLGLSGDEVKKSPGAYLCMKPMVGALEAIRSLIGKGFDVWIASKPPTGIALAYADKAQWVYGNLPELKRKIILTHNKGLLGDANDYLIDDRPHKADCHRFPGKLLVFCEEDFGWNQILEFFRDKRPLITVLVTAPY